MPDHRLQTPVPFQNAITECQEATRSQPQPPQFSEVSTVQTHDDQGNLPSETIVSPLSEAERALNGLYDARYGYEVEYQLQHSVLSNGVDSTLHLAVTRGDMWVVEYIVDYVCAQRKTVDLFDVRGSTPLLLASQAGSLGIVQCLLDAGASLHHRNSLGEQPLHAAIKSGCTAKMCRLLLENGADANAVATPMEGSYNAPLGLALEQIAVSMDWPEKQEAYVIGEILIDFGALLPSVNFESLAPRDRLLHCWLQQWVTVSKLPERAGKRSWLRQFFRMDCNPFSWIPAYYCPSRECKSFASYVFAHTDSGLAKALVDTCDVARYGQGLFRALVSPCKSARLLASSSQSDQSNDALLGELLERMHGLGVPIPFASGDDEGWTFINLAREDLPLRLRLAEILLAPEKGMLQPPSYKIIAEQCFRLIETPTGEQEDQGEAKYRQLKLQVLDAFGLQKSDVGEQKVNVLIQCVMHVLTKGIIDGTVAGSGLTIRDRLYGGLRLRRDFHLPDVQIPNSVLEGALEPALCSAEGRRLERPSDFSSSTDVPMNDIADDHPKETTGPLGDGDSSAHYHTPKSP